MHECYSRRSLLGGLSLAGPQVEIVPGLPQIASLLAHSVCEAIERIELSSAGKTRLTVRERDTLKQERIGIDKVGAFLSERLG